MMAVYGYYTFTVGNVSQTLRASHEWSLEPPHIIPTNWHNPLLTAAEHNIANQAWELATYAIHLGVDALVAELQERYEDWIN